MLMAPRDFSRRPNGGPEASAEEWPVREKTRVTNTISVCFRVVFLAHGYSTVLPSACAGAAKVFAGAVITALGGAASAGTTVAHRGRFAR